MINGALDARQGAAETPMVSVVLVAHNEEQSIRAALTSMLDQKGPALEVIVVDDASTDGTAHALRDLEDRRVTVVCLAENVGRAAARNLASQQATGKYLAIQDADDVSLPGRLQVGVDMMEQDPCIVMSSGQARFRDPRRGRWLLRGYPLEDGEIRGSLAAGDMAICHAGSLIRRSAFMKVGGYRRHLRRAQDLDLARRLASVGTFAATPDAVVDYLHPVILPFRYWRESRRYVKQIMTEASATPQLTVWESLRYPPAMARRLATFHASRP